MQLVHMLSYVHARLAELEVAVASGCLQDPSQGIPVLDMGNLSPVLNLATPTVQVAIRGLVLRNVAASSVSGGSGGSLAGAATAFLSELPNSALFLWPISFNR
jgi:hypothetical protein